MIILQEIDHNYGIDCEGPVSVDGDSVVNVGDPTEILSLAQRSTLMQSITQQEALSEEWMLHTFTTAKVFVHSQLH